MSKNVSNNFKNIIKSGGDFYAYASVKLVDGTTFTLDSETDFFATGNSYSEDAGDGLPLGSALSKQISIHLDNHDERFSNYDFYGAEIVLYTEADIPGGTTEKILEGTFTVIDSVAPGDVLDITAYDDMYKLDSNFISNLIYPATLQQLWNELCDYFDVSNGSPQFKNNDFIVQTKPDGATGREMAGYIAQIAVGNAVADANGRLCIKSYDFSRFDESETVTPGEIETDSGIHILSEFMLDPNIGTDDVVITGITTSVTNDEGESSTVIYGDDEYAISIDNPLITGKEQTAIALIGDELIGLSVRPFSGDFVPNPTIEVMDLVYVVDKKDKVYKSFVTSHGFTYLGFSNVSNGLESPERNRSTYSNNSSKIYQHVAQQLNNQKTQWETAVEDLQDELNNSSGLYPTEEKQPDGSTIYYLHDKPTLEESGVVIKITAQAIGISTDGGETYPTGLTVDGEAIIKILQTIGVNADWINAGAIQVKDEEGNPLFLVDMDTKQVVINGDYISIGGKSAAELIDQAYNNANEALEEVKKAKGFNVTLSNEYAGISVDNEGNYTQFPEIKTTVYVFMGNSDITNDCTFSIQTSAGVTGSWNSGTHTYTVTGLSTDSGWVDITSTYMTVMSAIKRFNIEKVKGGVNGQDGVPGRTYFIEPSQTVLKQDDDLIDSSLQKAIEFHSKDAKLTLILCGSYVDIMKRIVDIKAPLYGRFNEIILLKEFNYFDSSRFYPTLPTIDKIKYYATFGGTAFNILNIDYSVPFEENLITRFLENDSFFEKEAINVIASEIQKEENVNAILELIANGKTKFKELNDLLGDKSKDNISRYLAKLEEMDIIGKSYMVNDKFNKKPIYYIKNNLLDFYYSFVFKHQSTRQLMNSHLFYEKVVKEKFLKQYLPRKFEEIIKEYAIRKNSVELPLFFNAGRLIYNAKQRKEYINREFDLVLETDKGFIPIECKFFSRPLNENDINEEINQWKGLPFNVYKYGFASLNGFDEKLKENKDLILINSDDIYR